MTDLIHVDDLTKNTTRFDMLDEDTQRRLEALPYDQRQWWNGEKWLPDETAQTIFYDLTYRQKPKPETVVKYYAVYHWGVTGALNSAKEAKAAYPNALSIIRIETCTKTGKLISAENVEVGDEL